MYVGYTCNENKVQPTEHTELHEKDLKKRHKSDKRRKSLFSNRINDFEFFLSDLLIRRALQEHLTQEEQLISGRLSPEGWSRFLSQLKTMIHDVATYHLSPLQFAPCFFHLNPYRSF